jgi:hypothetical protein
MAQSHRTLHKNALHLLLSPIYALWKCFADFVVYDVHSHLWHILVFLGAYLLVRKLVTLPLQRRFLQAYYQSGCQVATTVYEYSPGANGGSRSPHLP